MYNTATFVHAISDSRWQSLPIKQIANKSSHKRLYIYVVVVLFYCEYNNTNRRQISYTFTVKDPIRNTGIIDNDDHNYHNYHTKPHSNQKKSLPIIIII